MTEHSCEHAHTHTSEDFNRVFAIGVVLNLTYVLAQVAFGIFGHSLALLADAGHNFGDVLGLVLAWGASHLVKRPATIRRTYGWRRTSIMAALLNALFLLVAVGAITWEALRRFAHYETVDANIVIYVAAVGLVLNGVTAWLFRSGRKADLNIRGAFIHMTADAAISAGVVAAGLAIRVTGWMWLDPAVSIVINIIIVIGTWGLLRESFNLALDAVPATVDLLQVKKYLGDEHHGGRAHRAFGHARRGRWRRVSVQRVRTFAGHVRNCALHHPDRTKRRVVFFGLGRGAHAPSRACFGAFAETKRWRRR
jgi:cobalt-zinc-cadmium efflux system protein